MKRSLLFMLVYCTSLVQFINSKKYRAIMSDEVIDYELDKSVPRSTKYFSYENLVLEQIDDDNYFIGGYGVCIKSMDKNLLLSQNIRTQYFQDGKWQEGAVKSTTIDMCTDYVNPSRFEYKFTKLWTPDICPPQKGDKWVIENQTLSAILDVPDLPANVPWRAFIKVYQGVPGMIKHSYGFGINLEFIPV